jgi:hypothetical protein
VLAGREEQPEHEE